jgi:hypothetical protein
VGLVELGQGAGHGLIRVIVLLERQKRTEESAPLALTDKKEKIRMVSMEMV